MARLQHLFITVLLLSIRHTDALTVTFGFGATTLLSGSLTACRPNATVATCTGGLAALDAFGRNLTKNNTTDHLVLIPEIDVSTPFVQMHPSGYSVNLDVFSYLGIDTYTIKPSLLSSRSSTNYTKLFREDVSPILTNSDIPSSDEWFTYVKNRYIFTVEGVRIGFLYITPSQQQFSTSAVPALTVAIKSLRRDADFVVVLYQDREVTGASAITQLGDNLPDILLDIGSKTANTAIGQVANTTLSRWLGTVQIDGYGVFLTATLDANNQVTKVGLDRVTLTTLPASLKDQQYYDFQTYLLGLSTAAASNDPILSHTTVAVAPSRVAGSYPCFGGECAQGTISAWSAAWRFETDIGFLNSGSPRGPGWEAGPVKTSDVWAFNTFSNTPCVGTILGLTVWELVNTSIAFCSFTADYNVLGDRFMQTFGLQIDYDNSSLSVAAGTRVRAIRIRDKTTGLYAPLERLKYYTFASDSYQCTGMPEISPILLRLYDGENVDATYSDEAPQVGTQQFLLAHDPYTPVFQNYLTSTPAKELSDFMRWHQTAVTCGIREYWSAGIATCLPCNNGMERDPTDSTKCVAITTVTSKILQIVLPIALSVFFLLVIIVLVIVFCFSRQLRNTQHAPKGGSAAIIFTDIQMSTKLWGTVPASMGLALDQHHAMIREAIRAHDAYEVKTVGDSFMIAVDSPQRATELAIQIQLDFAAAKWPRCIDQVYAMQTVPELSDIIEDEPTDLVDINTPTTHLEQVVSASQTTIDMITQVTVNRNKNTPAETERNIVGLRLRVGLHCGLVNAVFDDIAKGYDYYGNTVNIAARLEASCDGGQIIASREIVDSIEVVGSVFRVENLGTTQLRGVEGISELYQITPMKLVHRVFEIAKCLQSVDGEIEDAETLSSYQRSIQLTETEGTIHQALLTSLRPLAIADRTSHINALAKAWRIEMPKNSTMHKKEKNVLALLTQRLAAANQLRRKVSMSGEDSGNVPVNPFALH